MSQVNQADSGPGAPVARRFHSVPEAGRDLLRIAARARPLVSAYRGGLSPDLRERVMVAVSEANQCAGCTRVHSRWALSAGVSETELESIGLGDLTGLDRQSRAAIVFAVERVENQFAGPLEPELGQLVSEQLDNRTLNEIDAVARVMNFANLTVGSLERTFRARRL